MLRRRSSPVRIDAGECAEECAHKRGELPSSVRTRTSDSPPFLFFPSFDSPCRPAHAFPNCVCVCTASGVSMFSHLCFASNVRRHRSSLWAACTVTVARQSVWVPLARRRSTHGAVRWKAASFTATLGPTAIERTERTRTRNWENEDERVPSESVAAFLLRKRTRSITRDSCIGRDESECKRVKRNAASSERERGRQHQPLPVGCTTSSGAHAIGSQTQASIIASNLRKSESARATCESYQKKTWVQNKTYQREPFSALDLVVSEHNFRIGGINLEGRG